MAGVSLGGMPTDLDVQRLRDEIGVPATGAIVSYRQIEEVLKLSRNKPRWKTVVNAWRRKLDREHNLILRAVPNEGYRVLDGKGRVDYSTRTYKGGLKRIMRAASTAVRTERRGLDSNDVRVLDHIAKTGSQLRLQAATAAREMRYPEATITRLPVGTGNGRPNTEEARN